MVGALSEQRFWTFPKWQTWEPNLGAEEKIFPLAIEDRPVPVDPLDLPYKVQENPTHPQGVTIRVFWKKVLFSDGTRKATLCFSGHKYGSREEATRAAWSYFRDKRSAVRGETPASGKGLLHSPAPDGLRYHGGRNHTFICYAGKKELGDLAVVDGLPARLLEHELRDELDLHRRYLRDDEDLREELPAREHGGRGAR